MGERTIADIALAAGVSPSTIFGYAEGHTPNANYALVVSELLNLDLNYWLFGEDKASSGPDSGPGVKGAISFAESRIETLGRPVETLFRVHASGNLMAPTIPRGAEVICSKEISRLNDGCVYLIGAGSGEVFRRIRIRLDGNLEAFCDNPNFIGQTETVSREKLIAEALWVSHKP